MQVAVIIPTYNEAENLQPMVSALFLLPLDLKVYIVDDNSPDGTGRVADELARENQRLHVIHRAGKMGLRSAYITGIQQALNDGADAVVQMDADFSHDPARIPDMARLLESCDVVLGSRYVAGGSVDRDWAAWRKALSGFANFYARSILGMPQKDVTTGFRMWRRLTLQGMPLERIEANGYVFLVEMAYLAYCLRIQDRRASDLFCGTPFRPVKNVPEDPGRSSPARWVRALEFPRSSQSGKARTIACVRAQLIGGP